jgi:RNA polymerase sigma-70 factor (ECF subfamily)
MQEAVELSSLYSEFGARIYTFLRRLTRDDALAEDLTQQAFLQAAERFETFRGDGKVSNWLYRIATNVLHDHQRRLGGSRQVPWADANGADEDAAALAALPDPGPPVPQQLESRAATQCVRDCIGALPAPYKTALALYAVEGKTIEESAAILGCTAGAVKVRLHRARRLFKELAARHCEVSAGNDGGEVTCLPKPRARSRAR